MVIQKKQMRWREILSIVDRFVQDIIFGRKVEKDIRNTYLNLYWLMACFLWSGPLTEEQVDWLVYNCSEGRMTLSPEGKNIIKEILLQWVKNTQACPMNLNASLMRPMSMEVWQDPVISTSKLRRQGL